MNAESRGAAQPVLVFESAPDWWPELQRELRDCDVRAGEAGRLSDVPTAALTLVDARELAARPEEWAAAISSNRRTGAVIVLSSGADRSAEWWLRDLGVTSVLDAAMPRQEILRHCRRLLRQRVAVEMHVDG